MTFWPMVAAAGAIGALALTGLTYPVHAQRRMWPVGRWSGSNAASASYFTSVVALVTAAWWLDGWLAAAAVTLVSMAGSVLVFITARHWAQAVAIPSIPLTLWFALTSALR